MRKRGKRWKRGRKDPRKSFLSFFSLSMQEQDAWSFLYRSSWKRGTRTRGEWRVDPLRNPRGVNPTSKRHSSKARIRADVMLARTNPISETSSRKLSRGVHSSVATWSRIEERHTGGTSRLITSRYICRACASAIRRASWHLGRTF